MAQKTVSLVLGSGGARGLAHIGIIRWLEEHAYQIQSVSGSSMGALVGGIYATGKLNEFEQWVRAVSAFDMLTFLDISFGRGGFVKGERLMNTLRNLIGDRLIEDLPLTFTAVAADIVREREVWINTGSLFDAIRASISLPFFFTPFKYQGINLIDGGVLNPVPIAPTFHDLTDLTIAVNLSAPPMRVVEPRPIAPPVEAGSLAMLQDKIAQFLANFQASADDKDDDEWGMYYIANQSFDAMQGAIARQKLAAYPPDIVVELPRNACGTLEFDRAAEMIALGYQKAEEVLSAALES